MGRVLFILLVLCFLVPGIAMAEPKGEVVVAFGAFSATLDPQIQFVQPAYSMVWHIFDSLVYRDEEMNIKPGLMYKWEQLDPLSLKIWLHKGIKFHNGEPFDARAVKFTLERYIDPQLKFSQKFMFTDLKGVEIVDDYTAIIRLKTAKSPLIPYLCLIGIVPPGAASNKNMDHFGVNPVGTGPYKFVEFVPNDLVVVVANENYWAEEKKPRFKKITFRMMKEDATRVSALLAHEVDIIHNPPPDDFKRIKADPKLDVLHAPSPRHVWIGFNFSKKDLPFQDKRVRQALNYAVDRKEIIEFLLAGVGEAASSVLPTSVAYSKPQTPSYEYNLQKAKELMKAAGYPEGLPGTYMLLTPWGRYLKDREISEAIAGMWARIGVKCTVLPLEWATYLVERMKKGEGKWDVMLGAYGVLTLEPDWLMRRNFRSPNFLGYKNERLDELLDKGAATYDPAEQEKIYSEAQAIVWDDSPWVFIYDQPEIVGIQKRVKGFKPRVDEIIVLHDSYLE